MTEHPAPMFAAHFLPPEGMEHQPIIPVHIRAVAPRFSRMWWRGIWNKLINRNQEPEAYLDTEQGQVFAERAMAERAIYLRSDEYRATSRQRMEAARLARAVEVPDYKGWVYDPDGRGPAEGHFADGEELAEYCDGEGLPMPAWAYCCEEVPFDFDLFDEIDSYCGDNHAESTAENLKGTAELEAAWKAFLAANDHVHSYMVDYLRIVVLDRERYLAELKAAREVLAEASP